MLTIRPFKALRPTKTVAAAVASVPYDVIDSDEARELAAGNPYSFLHVVKPEIDLPHETDLYDEQVYTKGRDNLIRFEKEGVLLRDPDPAVYIYQLVQNTRSQTGVFCCVSVDDYDNGRIIRHELTRPDKEDDRTRHILTQKAHAEAVMLIAPDNHRLDEAITDCTAGDPLYDFTSGDGVRHRIWKSTDTRICGIIGSSARLYIADGHHRCKSASRVAETLRSGGMPPSDDFLFFPAVVFPENQMEILAYNRVITNVTDAQWNVLLNMVRITGSDTSVPKQKGDACLYYRGKWHTITLPEAESDRPDHKLDVARLHDGILAPVFGITDPRRDRSIHFVGGIRGTGALEKWVDSGKAGLGISLYPTHISELIDVSDAGLLMPPKSTWFEPKLRSGLLIHTF